MPPKQAGSKRQRDSWEFDPAAVRSLSDLGLVRSPRDVQALIDHLPYNTDDIARCPKDALAARKVHCLDGGLLAAAALRRLGHEPLIVFLDATEDDGHVLAIFKSADGKAFGAVGKSNFVWLRYREPVYRSLRELVMSYFESYYNIFKKKTLRAFTQPLNLARYDKLSWETAQASVDVIEQRLYEMKETQLLTKAQERALVPVDERSYKAGMLGIDMAGVHGAAEKADKAKKQ